MKDITISVTDRFAARMDDFCNELKISQDRVIEVICRYQLMHFTITNKVVVDGCRMLQDKIDNDLKHNLQ